MGLHLNCKKTRNFILHSHCSFLCRLFFREAAIQNPSPENFIKWIFYSRRIPTRICLFCLRSCMYLWGCSHSALNHSALQSSVFLETPLQSSAIILHLREREREYKFNKNLIRTIEQEAKPCSLCCYFKLSITAKREDKAAACFTHWRL